MYKSVRQASPTPENYIVYDEVLKQDDRQHNHHNMAIEFNLPKSMEHQEVGIS